jgi:hypothetical protein
VKAGVAPDQPDADSRRAEDDGHHRQSQRAPRNLHDVIHLRPIAIRTEQIRQSGHEPPFPLPEQLFIPVA